ncbi:FHA domain-containing protein [Clohesyomyces aquaticus]|uniref:RING-type E3 ubiquitin transferase n=1 Tax=Clohesyomyces aquaticus TaxID=1231657 RepID=A0A1Y2ABA7_9PLEO|nr:FHA domain-containing protein [Clohesyomyces aquaticus]
MTRNPTQTSAPGLTVRNQSGPTPATTPPASTMGATEGPSDGAAINKHLPSIRFIPHQDPRAGRPSLQFPTITRTLPDETSVIRVGRYSERDNIPEIPSNTPSAAAVGFKSKVVSRKHCELWCSNSQWYIKDVKSSSGTFLNHIRLSQPNAESKPFKIKDGDIIQLGIDFRGGEEMIFRCVKIRVECNRGWQQALNTFNKQTHQRLRNLAKNKKDSDSASTHSSECSICLMSIAPCQSLFVAPCSHVWHYKCIRPILNGPTWPNFLCPNCRAVADLEADVEDPGDFEEWESADAAATSDKETNGEEGKEDRHITPRASQMPLVDAPGASAAQTNGLSLADLESALAGISLESVNSVANNPVTPHRLAGTPASSSITQPVAINIQHTQENSPGFSPLFPQIVDGLSPDRQPDCPMTPRNDAGPFVLDGSGGRGSAPRRDESSSSNGNGAPTLPPLHMH